MAEKYNNRINVSMSEECLKAVCSIVEESGFFNGQADFVFSAVRSFSIRCTDRFNDYLRESKKDGETPLEVISLFDDGVSRYRDFLIYYYKEHYPGPNVKQIPIRPDIKFVQELKKISNYFFKSEDMKYLVETCRLAICEHLVEIQSLIESKNELESELSSIRASAKKGNFKIGD